MARMFGFIGNRADLGARVLALHADVLKVPVSPGGPMGWGMGFYQAGEVLLRRRPIDEREVIDLTPVVEGMRTDVLIGHVRRPTVGSLRTENTHPFRYRQWLFAQTGTIGGFAALRERLLESQPEFLRRNVRGDTDSELFFYLFLSFIHDAGHLADALVAPDQMRCGAARVHLTGRSPVGRRGLSQQHGRSRRHERRVPGRRAPRRGANGVPGPKRPERRRRAPRRRRNASSPHPERRHDTFFDRGERARARPGRVEDRRRSHVLQHDPRRRPPGSSRF